MAKLRVGVALLLPSPVAEEVDGLRRALRDRSLGRVPPHLTLVPPVNVRQDQLGTALAVLRSASAATPASLCVTLGPPASFLPANPVLYLPVVAGLSAIAELRERIWSPPLARPLTWPFVPHVTLADEIGEERITAAQEALAGYEATVAVDRVHLLVERRPGPYWRPLADVAFGPPTVVARGSPLAVELARSRQVDPEGAAVLEAEGEDRVIPAAPIAVPIVLTARRQGEVVGVAAAWLTPRGRECLVVVAGAHRGQGIGRHLDSALGSAVIDAGWA